MGQVRHGSATTTHAVRAAIPRSQALLVQLSWEQGINPKTVAKWRERTTVEDMKTGPTETRSTVLSKAEEAMAVAFRRHTLLPWHVRMSKAPSAVTLAISCSGGTWSSRAAWARRRCRWW